MSPAASRFEPIDHCLDQCGCRHIDALETPSEEVICDIAAWENSNRNGPFLTAEVAPRYVPLSRPNGRITINGGCCHYLPAQTAGNPQQCFQALRPDHRSFRFAVDGHPRTLITRFFNDFNLAHWSPLLGMSANVFHALLVFDLNFRHRLSGKLKNGRFLALTKIRQENHFSIVKLD